METGASQPTIFRAARKCLFSFRKCEGEMLKLDASIQPLFDKQHGLFQQWTSNVDVSVKGHASLDHRLRRLPSFQREIIKQLENLHQCIAQCMYIPISEKEAAFLIVHLLYPFFF